MGWGVAQTAETYKEGEHYLPLSTPVPTIVGKNKVEVTEIFRFGCGACYHFEKNLKVWKEAKPVQAELVKNPVVWNDATKQRASEGNSVTSAVCHWRASPGGAPA